MTNALHMTATQMVTDLNGRGESRKPVQVNFEATGFYGDATSLRRERRRNRRNRRMN